MDRLDKVISNQTGYTRKKVKELVKNGRVLVDNKIVLKSDIKIGDGNQILIDGVSLNVRKFIYLILNKPKGYVSATEDKLMPTVLELVPLEFRHRALFPAGRLDRNTTGLMIITDDGDFAHNILSPKKHIKKTYEVVIDIRMSDEMIKGFSQGINLIDGQCKPAKLEITGVNTGIVTLTEGKYHQIKRMFGCFGAKVLELKRIGMGNFFLPNDLPLGKCRELNKEEITKIMEDRNE